MLRPPSRGFTLVEVLVVVSISAALILMLTLLYRTAGRATAALQTNRADWNTEQFIRSQGRTMAPQPRALELFVGRRHELAFVTFRSAAAGHDGPPVFVRYRYDPESGRLTYQERRVPQWWRSAEPYSVILLLREFDDGKPVPIDLYRGIDELAFAYHGPAREARWQERWDERAQLPVLVRLQLRRAGRTEEILLETGNLLSVRAADSF